MNKFRSHDVTCDSEWFFKIPRDTNLPAEKKNSHPDALGTESVNPLNIGRIIGQHLVKFSLKIGPFSLC